MTTSMDNSRFTNYESILQEPLSKFRQGESPETIADIGNRHSCMAIISSVFKLVYHELDILLIY